MESQENMEQQQETAQPGAASGVAVGVALREAREQMGMSVEEVAGRLKFAPRQVAALEAGDFAQLPELAFIRGFVRSYARLLQLDEKSLLDALPGAPAAAAIQVRAARNEVPRRGAERMQQNLFWLGAAVVVVVLGIVAWKFDAGETRSGATQGAPAAATGSAPETGPTGAAPQNTAANQPEETTLSAQTGPSGGVTGPEGAARPGETAPAPQPPRPAEAAQVRPAQPAVAAHDGEKKPARVATHAAAPKASGVAAAATMAHARPRHAPQAASGVAATAESAPHAQGVSRAVHFEFAEDSWVEVRDGNGRLLLSTLGKQGASLNASGPPPLSVVIGNAKGVKLVYKGQPVALQPMAGSEVARLKLE
jgi:cytoskeleton protein RodZ